MQKTPEVSSLHEEQHEPSVGATTIQNAGVNGMIPQFNGMIPLMTFPVNYTTNNLPMYAISRPYPTIIPQQCPPYHMNVASQQKRPSSVHRLAPNVQVNQNPRISTSNNSMDHGNQIGNTKDDTQVRRQISQETNLDLLDSPRDSEHNYTDSLPTLTPNSNKFDNRLKSVPWGTITNPEPSTVVPHAVMQPHISHSMAPQPKYFIPVPLVYPNPAIKMAAPPLQRFPVNQYRTNGEVPIYKNRGDTVDRTNMAFGVNPFFATPKKEETDTHQEATELKNQINKNVEQLFAMVTNNKATSKTDETKNLNVENPTSVLDSTENGQLMQTVMQCCIEVETYWSQRTADCTPRSLILSCCKSIRSLITNDIRRTTDPNIVSSLQELTLSLILLFLISSLN